MKGVHLLYQVQVIFDGVYIRVSMEKPRKWPTQSALIEIFIYAKPPNLFVCSHLKTPRVHVACPFMSFRSLMLFFNPFGITLCFYHLYGLMNENVVLTV
jgi:hypothetical protein